MGEDKTFKCEYEFNDARRGRVAGEKCASPAWYEVSMGGAKTYLCSYHFSFARRELAEADATSIFRISVKKVHAPAVVAGVGGGVKPCERAR